MGGRDDTVTDVKALESVRCAGTFQGERCNRILFRATAQPIRHGGVVEIKCGKCGEMSFLIGGPPPE